MEKRYDRRHIAETLSTHAGQIHPSYCIGRKGENLNDSIKERFAHAFFATTTSTDLKVLWAFAEKESQHGELLLSFALKDGADTRALTEAEMETFEFSKYGWAIRALASTEDELREVDQAICVVVFCAT